VANLKLPPDTVLWWRQRQVDVAPPIDLKRLIAEQRVRHERFAALFRRPDVGRQG
jgi:hypothetical protein